EAAAATKRALAIVEDALPFIRKDTDQAIAEGLADLLYERLGLAAVSVANKTEILAYRGLASDHHLVHNSFGTRSEEHTSELPYPTRRSFDVEAAAATKRAIAIVEDALPFIRKDTDQAIAEGLADLLYERLGLAAVSVANKTEILAYRGLASDHHLVHDSVGT